MKPTFALRDLFWLVLVVAIGSVVVKYSAYRVTYILLEAVIVLVLVVAAGVLVGRYVAKAPISAGVAAGLLISFGLGHWWTADFKDFVRHWMIPEGTKDTSRIAHTVFTASFLLHGYLGGCVAAFVARSHKG